MNRRESDFSSLPLGAANKFPKTDLRSLGMSDGMSSWSSWSLSSPCDLLSLSPASFIINASVMIVPSGMMHPGGSSCPGPSLSLS